MKSLGGAEKSGGNDEQEEMEKKLHVTVPDVLDDVIRLLDD